MKKSALIITGTGNPARAAANIYAVELPKVGFDVYFVENTISAAFVIRFFWKRLRRFGIVHTISTFFLRLSFLFSKSVEKTYSPDLELHDLSGIDRAYLAKVNPDIVITNACALLDEELIVRIKEHGTRIINVHNGINPRYRGTGNIWAFYERNFDLAGVTLHHLDQGIDTGSVICARRIDFIGLKVPFEKTDIASFESGARLAVEYIDKGSIDGNCIIPPVRSRAFTYPSFGEFRTAKARYEAALSHAKPRELERRWQQSFEHLATDQDKNVYQRQHWGNSNTVVARDAIISELMTTYATGNNVLDLGCGDGRYRNYWPDYAYWGYDYSYDTLLLGGDLRPSPVNEDMAKSGARHLTDDAGNHFIIGPVDDMPLQDNSFSNVLAVGLFQHIDNTGASVDEMLRVTAPEGHVIINTLRQFSLPELMLILCLSVAKPTLFRSALSILKQDYFSGREIGGTKLARRYSSEELRFLFKPHAELVETQYQGLFGTRLLSKEIFLVFRKKP